MIKLKIIRGNYSRICKNGCRISNIYTFLINFIMTFTVRLEERYIEEEISGELYHKYRDKYNEEKAEIEKNLLRLSKQVSNLDESVGFAIKIALQLPLKWVSADYNTKKRIQFLLFPKGISYSKKTDECRTPRINKFFLYIAYFQQVTSNKKRGIPELGLDFASFATLVAGSRIELPTFGL